MYTCVGILILGLGGGWGGLTKSVGLKQYTTGQEFTSCLIGHALDWTSV